MKRKTFFSFHYKPDCWRASQVRNIGAIEGNSPVSDNDWEEITKGGDKRIESWIKEQLQNRSCTIVLVGENTANRKWINYEIIESWNSNLGVVGVCVHGLKDSNGDQSTKGKNPFDYIKYRDANLSSVVKLYDTPYSVSTNVYEYIKINIADWVEEAINIRMKH